MCQVEKVFVLPGLARYDRERPHEALEEYFEEVQTYQDHDPHEDALLFPAKLRLFLPFSLYEKLDHLTEKEKYGHLNDHSDDFERLEDIADLHSAIAVLSPLDYVPPHVKKEQTCEDSGLRACSDEAIPSDSALAVLVFGVRATY